MSFKLIRKPSLSVPSKRANRLLNQIASPVVPHRHPIEFAAEAIEHEPWTEVPSTLRETASPRSASIVEGQGSPMPERARTMLGEQGIPRSSMDDIRLHTDAQAGRLAHLLGARAAAWGHDIMFAPGEFRPQHEQGMRLLRHEAFHASLGMPAFSLSRDPSAMLDAVHVGEQITDAELRSLSTDDLTWLRQMLRFEARIDVAAIMITRIDSILHEGTGPNSSLELDDVLPPPQEVETEEQQIERVRTEIAGKTGRAGLGVVQRDDVGAEQLTDVALGLIKTVPAIAKLDEALKNKEKQDVDVSEDEAALAAFESRESFKILSKLEGKKHELATATSDRKQLKREQKGARKGLDPAAKVKLDDSFIAAQTAERDLEREVKDSERDAKAHAGEIKQIENIRKSLRSNRIQADKAAGEVVKARTLAEQRVGPALEQKVAELRRLLERAEKKGEGVDAATAKLRKYEFEATLQYLQRNGYRLTEPAKQIYVMGPAGDVTLRRERSGKEGTVRQKGSLEWNEDDLLRGIALAEGHGPMREIDPAFREATHIPDEFRVIFELFAKSEGKPDDFFTDSALGWTLGTGFTGNKLAGLMAELETDDPDTYQRLFGQYGVDVQPEKYSTKVSYSIPEGDYQKTVADRAGKGEEMPMQMQEAPAKDAFLAMRRDAKFLAMMATSTSDPIFRAEFTKFFWEQFAAAKSATLKINGKTITWGSFGSQVNNNTEFQAVWLLPFVHGAIAKRSGEAAIARAEKLLSEHPELSRASEAYAPAWWAASHELRTTTGLRWFKIKEAFQTHDWFRRLTKPELTQLYGYPTTAK